MSSNLVHLSERRMWADMRERLAQNAIIIHAAISDSRLTRRDIIVLSRMLDGRALSDRLVSRKENEHSLQRLIKTGYLIDKGIWRNPELPDFCPLLRRMELTERELTRSWL